MQYTRKAVCVPTANRRSIHLLCRSSLDQHTLSMVFKSQRWLAHRAVCRLRDAPDSSWSWVVCGGLLPAWGPWPCCPSSDAGPSSSPAAESTVWREEKKCYGVMLWVVIMVNINGDMGILRVKLTWVLHVYQRVNRRISTEMDTSMLFSGGWMETPVT